MKLWEINVLIFKYSCILAESESFDHEFYNCSVVKLQCHFELLVEFFSD